MIVFRDVAALEARRVVAAGPLAPLADALAAELVPWREAPLAPDPRKARLTRHGGRCPADQALLAFDPAAPHRHRCPRCARWWEGRDHDDWWVHGYQLWLAERATQAALLFALRGDPVHADMATRIVRQCAEQYARWPNRDNVLGPSRPFFSTYLESLWLLQLAAAFDLLDEGGAVDGPFRRFVRDQLLAPSRALIASYPEGDSNRQAWNASAIVAASLLLGDRASAERALTGAAGIEGLLRRALLDDGSWYEGENYHQFAWRGLWYGVQMAEAAEIALDPELVARFDRGARVLVRTALPDLTVPSRRDAPHRVSLRQWRYAEMLELALARSPGDAAARAGLAQLYADDIAPGDTGRARSTGEAERNEPPVHLARADLGWKALACALPVLPPAAADAGAGPSVLLPAQGFAILRRDHGRVYVGLDYGATGGGHGHPDRLNLLLAAGATRWLDDMGAGSYTSHDLFWYRSSVSHNAPIVDGRTQRGVAGTLHAFDENGGAAWVSAEVDGIAPDVHLARTVVVMDGYLVDELRWRAPRPVTVDLPLHADGTFAPALEWQRTDLALPTDADPGYGFLRRIEAAPWPTGVTPVLHAVRGTARATARLLLPEGASLWRADGPGEPGEAARRFHAVRVHGREGVIVAVWDWIGDVVRDLSRDASGIVVHLGAHDHHHHARGPAGWQVERHVGIGRSTIDLAGLTASRDAGPAHGVPVLRPGSGDRSPRAGRGDGPASVALARGVDWHATLAAPHWRGTEDDWAAAGSPTADVTVRDEGRALHLIVAVAKAAPCFTRHVVENPLDNEHPDINSDGLQVHLAAGDLGEARWIIVPDGEGGARVTARTPAAEHLGLGVRTRADAQGWRAEVVIPLEASARAAFRLDLLVNEISADRERRRGQLVLSGARGQRAYLVGDRQPVSCFLDFATTDA